MIELFRELCSNLSEMNPLFIVVTCGLLIFAMYKDMEDE